MKALSIRQPWAWLIAKGYKDIENRNWSTNLQGRVYIHAGRRFDDDALLWLMEKGLSPIRALIPSSHEIYHGGIIGEVDIVDCVTYSSSPWFVGKYGFVLANPKAYDKPIPCKGQLRFFEPKIESSKMTAGYLT